MLGGVGLAHSPTHILTLTLAASETLEELHPDVFKDNRLRVISRVPNLYALTVDILPWNYAWVVSNHFIRIA